MAKGIGAGGVIGIARETTAGTYLAPTKFFPIRSESLEFVQDVNQRRVIRKTADVLGAVKGNSHVEGDIDMEVLHDVLPYFLYATRGTVTKTGAAAPFTYEWVPKHTAEADKTLSITVVRNGVVFGYTGCVVGAMSFTTDNGMAVMTISLLGRAEAVQAAPTETFSTVGPFGEGSYEIKIPSTGSVLSDVASFTLQIDDGGEVQNRLRNVRGAAFISHGERTATLSVERDFESRTDYDAYKNVTEQSASVGITDGTHSVTLLLPKTFQNDYGVGLQGVGDLIMANIDYVALHDSTTGAAVKITVVTNEDIL